MSEPHNGGPALLLKEKGVFVFASRLHPNEPGDKRKLRLWVALFMPGADMPVSMSRNGWTGAERWCVVDDFGNLVLVPA
ncbi:MAG: hypothetical protein WAQ08_05815 [Aquabacterium sp.]|uniref:hypothetical protein n=1 Tax=Aquabacterium sp. TaxID=1872578 RepID=UPI003BB0C730